MMGKKSLSNHWMIPNEVGEFGFVRVLRCMKNQTSGLYGRIHIGRCPWASSDSVRYNHPLICGTTCHARVANSKNFGFKRPRYTRGRLGIQHGLEHPLNRLVFSKVLNVNCGYQRDMEDQITQIRPMARENEQWWIVDRNARSFWDVS